ncbi:MAG: hypothetical protein DMG32_21840 [Acidobacteria bacterium]|nr:MAG: hypothetical protein DMG32_21840 [Acidobacteriota bacterium]
MKQVFAITLLLFSIGCKKPITVVVPPLPVPLPEVPTGFDTLTNGFTTQVQHDADRAQFEEDAVLPQLGPAFNARSCFNCHTNPVSGGNSQVSEHRIGPDEPGDEIASAALIHDQSTDANTQQVAPFDALSALRMSTSLFGLAFVEQVSDADLLAIAKANGGQAIMVPVLESPGTKKVGRFGWKCQHATLLSFAGDADFNEKGVGNRLVKDPVNGIEDQQQGSTTGCTDPHCEDIDFYASFMRALKAPPRGPIDASVRQGEQVFDRIGCNSCHVDTLHTPTVQFHPYGDFLLHDIGTGDGVMQGQAPAKKVRTAALWGLRTRARLLHDGRAFDIPTAIKMHGREAHGARVAFKKLSPAGRVLLLRFLNSL